LSFEGKGKTTSKKKPNISSNSISSFSFAKEPFKKKRCATKTFFGKLESFNYKKKVLQSVESNWLKRYGMHLCQRISFPSKK